MGKWGKLSFAQKKCVTAAGLAMQRTGMAAEGDRIGVAFSGGVDSFVMTKVLLIRQAILPFDLELMLLHVNPGFDPANHKVLADWAADNGLSAHFEVSDFGPRAHTSENKKNSPCFFCAWHRRKRLFDLCRDYGLNRLALGHNADDLVSTFFMNVVTNGRVDGLSPNESFFHGRLRLIRPLFLIEKKYIRAAARQWGLPIVENPCPSSGVTHRDRIHAWLEQGFATSQRARSNTYGAVTRWQLDAASKSI